MARMARSYSSRAFAIDSRLYISVVRGDSCPSRSWTVSSGRPAFRASVAQGAAWLSGSHHAAERDGYPKPVVAPYLKALRRSSVQLCAVYSSLGAWFFRAA